MLPGEPKVSRKPAGGHAFALEPNGKIPYELVRDDQWITVGTFGNTSDNVDALLRRNPHPYAYGDAPGPPSFSNSWTNSPGGQPVQFVLVRGGWLRIRGDFTGGTDSTTVFTLPARFRPPYDTPYLLPTVNPAAYAVIVIQADGQVVYQQAVNGLVSMPGLAGGQYGSAASVAQTTVDTFGRVTAIANVAIQITESQVTNLTTDLAAKVPKSVVTAKGDLIVGSVSASVSNLSVGSNNTVLTADSTQPLGVKWGGAPVLLSTVTAKGDLIVGSVSGSVSNLSVGSNGTVLTADSTQALGVKWGTAASGSVATDAIWDAKGDLAVATGADAASKLTVGTNGYVLTADSGESTGVKWAVAGVVTGGTVKLYDYTVSGSDKASIDTNVDGTTVADFAGYSILEIFFVVRTDDAAAVAAVDVTVNNDTGANYDRQVFQGSNTTAAAAVSLAQTKWAVNAHGSGGSASYATAHRMVIPFYADTTFNKTGEIYQATPDATAGNNSLVCLAIGWRSTAAVTRVKIAAQGAAKLKVGSRLAVYGR
jgi:hypothetical protein